MNIYIVLAIIFAIISILALLYFSSYFKLKKYKEKMDKAEGIIDVNLNKKLDIIIAINGEVKKVTNKKDYLKDYVSIRDLIITNIEKDWKLEEATKLVNNLAFDYNELNKDNKFKELMQNLRSTDEILTSAKNVFNSNPLKYFINNI